jgi:hypothetical protein
VVLVAVEELVVGPVVVAVEVELVVEVPTVVVVAAHGPMYEKETSQKLCKF